MKPRFLAYNPAIAMDNPGDYYAHKTKLADFLRTAIESIEEARKLDPYADVLYAKLIEVLADRLEIARYVGD